MSKHSVRRSTHNETMSTCREQMKHCEIKTACLHCLEYGFGRQRASQKLSKEGVSCAVSHLVPGTSPVQAVRGRCRKDKRKHTTSANKIKQRNTENKIKKRTPLREHEHHSDGSEVDAVDGNTGQRDISQLSWEETDRQKARKQCEEKQLWECAKLRK